MSFLSGLWDRVNNAVNPPPAGEWKAHFSASIGAHARHSQPFDSKDDAEKFSEKNSKERNVDGRLLGILEKGGKYFLYADDNRTIDTLLSEPEKQKLADIKSAVLTIGSGSTKYNKKAETLELKWDGKRNDRDQHDFALTIKKALTALGIPESQITADWETYEMALISGEAAKKPRVGDFWDIPKQYAPHNKQGS